MPRLTGLYLATLNYAAKLGFGKLCSKKMHIMLLAMLIIFTNYAKIMLLRFYTDFKENKDRQ